jgi:hypothetical protein
VFCLFCSAYRPAGPSPAQDIVDNACITAAKQHKKVFLIFHASWCVVCKRLEAVMNDPTCKQLFDGNYVVTYIDFWERSDENKSELENGGAMELLKEYAGNMISVPYWAVLDEKGNKLSDCKMPPEKTGDAPDVIGLPEAGKELDYFIKLLASTSHMNEAQLEIIRHEFIKAGIEENANH